MSLAPRNCVKLIKNNIKYNNSLNLTQHAQYVFIIQRMTSRIMKQMTNTK